MIVNDVRGRLMRSTVITRLLARMIIAVIPSMVVGGLVIPSILLTAVNWLEAQCQGREGEEGDDDEGQEHSDHPATLRAGRPRALGFLLAPYWPISGGGKEGLLLEPVILILVPFL